jgi:hypothetical protein
MGARSATRKVRGRSFLSVLSLHDGESTYPRSEPGIRLATLGNISCSTWEAPGIPCALLFQGTALEALPGHFVPRECGWSSLSRHIHAPYALTPYICCAKLAKSDESPGGPLCFAQRTTST